jgi:hypothetical protein
MRSCCVEGGVIKDHFSTFSRPNRLLPLANKPLALVNPFPLSTLAVCSRSLPLASSCRLATRRSKAEADPGPPEVGELAPTGPCVGVDGLCSVPSWCVLAPPSFPRIDNDAVCLWRTVPVFTRCTGMFCVARSGFASIVDTSQPWSPWSCVAQCSRVWL